MQKSFEIEQGVPEIWGFKGLEMILLHETKKRKNTTERGGVKNPSLKHQKVAISKFLAILRQNLEIFTPEFWSVHTYEYYNIKL